MSKSTTLKTNSESDTAEPEDDETSVMLPIEATLIEDVMVIEGSASKYVIKTRDARETPIKTPGLKIDEVETLKVP